MKYIKTIALLVACLGSTMLYAQKKTQTKTKAKPEVYYNDDGEVLVRKDIKSKAGVLVQSDFYRKSDSVHDSRHYYANGIIKEEDYYSYHSGKITYKVLCDNKGRAAETDFLDTNGAIATKSMQTFNADGTTKTSDYTGEGKLKSEETADTYGRMLTEINYKPDGTILTKSVNTFDGKPGQMDKSETSTYDSANVMIRKEVKIRSAKTTETTEYYPSGKMKEHEVEQDTDGRGGKRINEWTFYKEDGTYYSQKMKLTGKPSFRMWQPVETDNYTADGKLDGKLMYTYNDEGSESGYTWYDGKGKVIGSMVRTFQPDGNYLYDTYYDGAGKQTSIRNYKYDKKGILKEVVDTYPDGKKTVMMRDGTWLK